MALSKFLQSRVGDAKELVGELGKKFEYVSVLGSDVKSLNVRATKRISNISDGSDADRGFVVKLSSGNAFFEYSLDDITGDKRELAKKIASELALPKELQDSEISSKPIEDEPLEKAFERETDVDDYSPRELLDACATLKDKLLEMSDKIVNATALIRTLDVSKLFVSKNRTLTQRYAWVNGYILAAYKDFSRLVNVREGANGHMMKNVLEELSEKLEKAVDKAAHLVTAKPIEPGLYDVITDPSITGLLAHEAFGHGVEMDMFVKDRALAKHCIGTQVASPICNMHDGAAATLSVASYFFDDDGVLAHDTLIIKDGILLILRARPSSAVSLRATEGGRATSARRTRG